MKRQSKDFTRVLRWIETLLNRLGGLASCLDPISKQSETPRFGADRLCL